VLLAACLAAHTSLDRAPAQPLLTPVDPGTADISPLAQGRRDLRVDLRTPVGFENLYQLSPHVQLFPGQPAGDAGAGPFVRISGGLIAVFPRSTYQATGDGRFAPTIPPGTIFYQADARRLLTDASPQPRAWSGASAYAGDGRERLAMRSLMQPLNTPPAPLMIQPGRLPPNERLTVRSSARSPGFDDTAQNRTIWTDEAFRQQRIARLLALAYEAGVGEGAGGASGSSPSR
jgi:hypothetical protein